MKANHIVDKPIPARKNGYGIIIGPAPNNIFIVIKIPVYLLMNLLITII